MLNILSESPFVSSVVSIKKRQAYSFHFIIYTSFHFHFQKSTTSQRWNKSPLCRLGCSCSLKQSSICSSKLNVMQIWWHHRHDGSHQSICSLLMFIYPSLVGAAEQVEIGLGGQQTRLRGQVLRLCCQTARLRGQQVGARRERLSLGAQCVRWWTQRMHL